MDWSRKETDPNHNPNPKSIITNTNHIITAWFVRKSTNNLQELKEDSLLEPSDNSKQKTISKK